MDWLKQTTPSFGITGSSSSGSSTVNPWAPQVPYLTQGFGYAQDLYNRGIFPGDWWVDPNAMQTGAWQGGAEAAGYAQDIAEQFYGFGGQLAPGLSDAQKFYQGVMQGGEGLTNPYQSQQYQDIIEQESWNDVLQGMYDTGVSSILDMQAMQDRDARLGASMAGVSGGSDNLRQYAASALGAQTQASDLLLGYQNVGLDYARGLADRWAGANLSNQMEDFNRRAGAAGALGSFGSQGLDYLTQGYGISQGGYGDMAGWGDYAYGFDENQLAGQMARFNAPWQNLANYWNIVGGANWGSQTDYEEDKKGFSLGFG